MAYITLLYPGTIRRMFDNPPPVKVVSRRVLDIPQVIEGVTRCTHVNTAFSLDIDIPRIVDRCPRLPAKGVGNGWLCTLHQEILRPVSVHYATFKNVVRNLTDAEHAKEVIDIDRAMIAKGKVRRVFGLRYLET